MILPGLATLTIFYLLGATLRTLIHWSLAGESPEVTDELANLCTRQRYTGVLGNEFPVMRSIYLLILTITILPIPQNHYKVAEADIVCQHVVRLLTAHLELRKVSLKARRHKLTSATHASDSLKRSSFMYEERKALFFLSLAV